MKKLKIGDVAPAFSGITQNGDKINLSDLNGRKLVLYFYPKDNTPGCTAQACSLRDGYSKLKNSGFEIIGVSINNEKSHQKFIEKYSLPFNLIADTDNSIAEKYGVWGEKKFMGKTYTGTIRTTFLIDENGIITDIIEKVDTKNHSEQILNSI